MQLIPVIEKHCKTRRVPAKAGTSTSVNQRQSGPMTVCLWTV